VACPGFTDTEFRCHDGTGGERWDEDDLEPIDDVGPALRDHPTLAWSCGSMLGSARRFAGAIPSRRESLRIAKANRPGFLEAQSIMLATRRTFCFQLVKSIHEFD
jgi:hypothetical protein